MFALTHLASLVLHNISDFPELVQKANTGEYRKKYLPVTYQHLQVVCVQIDQRVYFTLSYLNSVSPVAGTSKNEVHQMLLQANKAAKRRTGVWVTTLDIFKNTWRRFLLCFRVWRRRSADISIGFMATKPGVLRSCRVLSVCVLQQEN